MVITLIARKVLIICSKGFLVSSLTDWQWETIASSNPTIPQISGLSLLLFIPTCKLANHVLAHFFFFHLVKWSQQQLKYNLFSSLVPKAINALGTLLAFQVIAGKFYQMLLCIASSQPLISVSLLPDPWPTQHLRGSVRVPYCLYQLWF